MPALLRNLSARTPTMEDLEAVTELLVACDVAEYGVSDYTQQDMLSDWQRPGFNLKTDAWVIVTTKGQLVGYACVWHEEHVRIHMLANVHPEYRGRGIGTLLLRLAEAQAREHLKQASPGVQVTLSATVSNVNEAARRLLEWEGYTPEQHFWRLVIEMDDMPSQSFEEFYHHGKLKLDLVVDTPNLLGITPLHKRTGMYVARQYDIYEKELRAGERPIPGRTDPGHFDPGRTAAGDADPGHPQGDAPTITREPCVAR